MESAAKRFVAKRINMEDVEIQCANCKHKAYIDYTNTPNPHNTCTGSIPNCAMYEYQPDYDEYDDDDDWWDFSDGDENEDETIEYKTNL